VGRTTRTIGRFLGVLALVLGLGIASGCRPKHPYVWAKDVPQTDVAVQNVPLRPGDQIVIQVTNLSEVGTEPFTVNADGSVNLPLIGVLDVEGLTPAAAAGKLNARLNGIIVNPDARISVVKPREPVVVVVGEVQEPNRFAIESGESVLTALARAGGLTEFASPDHIYVVRQFPKQERIRFRYSDLTGGVARSADFELRDGDIVVVE
jgi:polysaccharide export outer membrane protein